MYSSQKANCFNFARQAAVAGLGLRSHRPVASPDCLCRLWLQKKGRHPAIQASGRARKRCARERHRAVRHLAMLAGEGHYGGARHRRPLLLIPDGAVPSRRNLEDLIALGPDPIEPRYELFEARHGAWDLRCPRWPLRASRAPANFDRRALPHECGPELLGREYECVNGSRGGRQCALERGRRPLHRAGRLLFFLLLPVSEGVSVRRSSISLRTSDSGTPPTAAIMSATISFVRSSSQG